jgi:hypothetical protein
MSSQIFPGRSPIRELAAEKLLRYRRRPYNKTTGHQQQCGADRDDLTFDTSQQVGARPSRRAFVVLETNASVFAYTATAGGNKCATQRIVGVEGVPPWPGAIPTKGRPP